MKALWTSFIMILYKSCTKNACSRVAALVGVGPIDTSCTFHGPTMTYQTDRIWHAKATPQPNKTPCLTPPFFLFHSSLMHQQNSVNQKIRDYALQMEKLQHVIACLSMLFEASCTATASCSELPVLGLPSWTKKDPTDLSEWFERSKSHRLKAPKKGCNACSRVVYIYYCSINNGTHHFWTW